MLAHCLTTAINGHKIPQDIFYLAVCIYLQVLLAILLTIFCYWFGTRGKVVSNSIYRFLRI